MKLHKVKGETPANLLSEGSIVIYNGRIGILVGNKPFRSARLVTSCGASIEIDENANVELVISSIELATIWMKQFSAIMNIDDKVLRAERRLPDIAKKIRREQGQPDGEKT